MKRDPKTRCLIRTFLVYLAVLAVGVLILVKAVMVQTKEGDELRALADQVETRFDTLQASRGDILACDGSLLPTSRFSKSASTHKSLMTASSTTVSIS